MPTVDNDGGASNITANSAVLNGDLISTGTAPTEVWMYWGTFDGGTAYWDWQNTNYNGFRDVGVFTNFVSGLLSNTVYYYRCYASNIMGAAWAPATTNFTTTGGPVDEDYDGMCDNWEIQCFGSTNAMPMDDVDGDGMDNLCEYIAGTDPTNSQSRFVIDIAKTGGMVEASFLAIAATGTAYEGSTRYYDVETTTNILSANWFAVPGYVNIVGDDTIKKYTNTPTACVTCYRAKTRLGGQDVATLNAVACVKMILERNKSYVSCINLDLIGGNSISNVFKPAELPSGTTMCLWDQTQQKLFGQSLAAYPAPKRWNPGTNTLERGMSFWIHIPSCASNAVYTNLVCGQVPTATNTIVTIVPGFGLLGYPYPAPINFTNTTLGMVAKASDVACAWRTNVWVAETWTSIPSPHWAPGTGISTLGIAEGFVYKSTAATNKTWIEVKPYLWP